jgi:hypothetical protein
MESLEDALVGCYHTSCFLLIELIIYPFYSLTYTIENHEIFICYNR